MSTGCAMAWRSFSGPRLPSRRLPTIMAASRFGDCSKHGSSTAHARGRAGPLGSTYRRFGVRTSTRFWPKKRSITWRPLALLDGRKECVQVDVDHLARLDRLAQGASLDLGE